MRVAIIGGGPSGLFLGAGLARRGHAVTVVERDGGPARDGSWERPGVAHFDRAHVFGAPVVSALRAELPAALARWVGLGAEQVGPDQSPVGVRSRRTTFERALREAAADHVVLRPGHVDGVRSVDGVAIGLDVGGDFVPAELVVDASGASGGVTARLGDRAGFGGPGGPAYGERLHQLRNPADLGPLTSPLAWQDEDRRATVVPHEHGMFSVLVAGTDNATHDAAARRVPALAAWTDPRRSVSVGPVRMSAVQRNRYRGQYDVAGRPLLAGLVAVGDAVATTTPTHGRGVALALAQGRALLAAVDAHGDDTTAAVARFDAWCTREVAPYVRDRIAADAAAGHRPRPHTVSPAP